MGTLRAVVFDLGGVLLDWDPRHLYRQLFDDEEAMEEFLATVCTPAWNRELDGGRPVGAAVSDLARRHPANEIFDRLVERFALEPGTTLFVDDIPANVEGALASGLPAVLFTGAASLRRQLAERGVSLPAEPQG